MVVLLPKCVGCAGYVPRQLLELSWGAAPSLRQRDDFKSLIAELEKAAK
jgi:hypothetical protein